MHIKLVSDDYPLRLIYSRCVYVIVANTTKLIMAINFVGINKKYFLTFGGVDGG